MDGVCDGSASDKLRQKGEGVIYRYPRGVTFWDPSS
jgi:hypothetical protein